jgi:hypothetical protein
MCKTTTDLVQLLDDHGLGFVHRNLDIPKDQKLGLNKRRWDALVQLCGVVKRIEDIYAEIVVLEDELQDKHHSLRSLSDAVNGNYMVLPEMFQGWMREVVAGEGERLS